MTQTQEIAELKPQPNDLIVIPENMEFDGEAPCHLYRVKFLDKPSIVRSGGYSMSFLESIQQSSLLRWLGIGCQQSASPSVYGREDVISTRELKTDAGHSFIEETMKDGNVFMRLATEEDKPTGEKIEKFFRYVREHDFIEKTDGVYPVSISPRGGIAFYIELDASTNSFAFSYAMCHENDNFNKNTARAISKGRFAADDWYEVENYNPDVGIVENIESALAILLHDVKEDDIVGPRFSSLSPKMNLYELKQIYERI